MTTTSTTGRSGDDLEPVVDDEPEAHAADDPDAVVDTTDDETRERDPAPSPGDGPAEDRRRFVRVMAIASGLAFVPLITILWDVGLDPLRTATPQGFFSNFYDIQARALMRGDLAVPDGVLSIEAFVVDGRDYMYFPPFPAIVRIPFLAIGGDGLDGRLTAPAILVAWIVTAVTLSMLLWRMRHVLRPDASLGRLEAYAYGAFVLTAMGGSILVFIAALPWVYHEAYAWGIAAAVGSAFAMIGLVERPCPRRALVAGVWATVAVLSRTTTGWAVAIALLMCAIWLLAGRRGPDARRMWWPTALAGIVPLVIGGSINYAKFRHPWLFPLENQVWTEVNQHRQDALDANGGGLVGPQFFTTSFVNYLRPDGIRFTSIFPWITLPAEPAKGYNGAFVDQAYRTGSITAFMPGLFAMALTGLAVCFRPHAEPRMRWMRFAVLGMLGITTGVMFYGYLAHRYTAEFFPVLVVAGGLGTVAVAHRLDGLSTIARRSTVAAIGVVAVFGVAANSATALHASRTTTGGEALREFLIVQERLSGLPGASLADHVVVSDALPPDAPTDQLRVVGECDALYLSTGDTYQPWLPVEVRDVAALVTVLPDDEVDGPDTAVGSLPLFRLEGLDEMAVGVQRVGRVAFRVIVEQDGEIIASPYFRAPRDFEFQVSVRVDIERGRYRIGGPSFWGLETPMSSHLDDWITQPRLVVIDEPDTASQRDQGVSVEYQRSPEPALCDDLVGD